MDQPQLEFVGPDDSLRFQRWIRKTQDDYLSVDTETTGLDVWHDRVRMVQFGDQMHGWAIPYEANPAGQALVGWAMDWAADSRRVLSAHRMKFDSLFLQNAGHNVEAIREDGKASAHLVDPTCSGLKEAAVRAFGAWAGEGEKELAAVRRKNRWTWKTTPLDTYEYWYYAALDPVLEARLQAHNAPLIDRTLYGMELDVSLALQRAETRGICVDLDYCAEQYEILDAELKAIRAEWDWINLGSGPQIAFALEAGWGIKLPRGKPGPKTGRVQAKADEDTLEQYRGNELVDVVLRYRGLARNAETYFGSYLELAIDDRIHTCIETLGARTGRMSSNRPNMQNVPKASAGDYVRRAFLASPGRTLVLFDFDQIEYRIFASACGELEMIDAINAGEDLHAVVARIVYNDPSITKADKRRDDAKNGNFAEIYMSGLETFAKTAGITEREAKEFKRKYHARFTHVKPFQQAVIRSIKHDDNSITSRFGRRIPVDYGREYAGVDYLIQSSAADELKLAIQRIGESEWDEYFVLPVHDELIFDVPNELVRRALHEIPALMEDRENFRVPLTVSATTAKRWGEKLQKEAA
jgi:DNA polymerase-1